MADQPHRRRLAVLLEYDGTAYGGSQYQKNAPTVQGALERALSSLTGESARVSLAGRTDAGVHALGQVASFLTAGRHSPDVFVRGLNALLPRDITVRAAAEVDPRFDSRRQATSRWYRYTLDTRPQRPALLRGRVWHVGRRLDLGAMARAAAALVGRHDFAAFVPPSEARRLSTERVVARAEVAPGPHGLVWADVEANAFLRSMVRRVAGALAEVGTGKRTEAEFRELVRKAVPGSAARAAPPQGLCLMRVRYESGLFDDEADENL
jgi:tRNA pseudouridine38-40 synthase